MTTNLWYKVLSHKNYFIILIVFLFYWFLLTPIGSYKYPDTMQNNEGFHSVLKIDPGDDTGYYAYIRSGVIDGDFDFFNEKRYYHFDAINTAGYSPNFWYIGQSLIWLPFFLIGHVIAWFFGLSGCNWWLFLSLLCLNVHRLQLWGFLWVNNLLRAFKKVFSTQSMPHYNSVYLYIDIPSLFYVYSQSHESHRRYACRISFSSFLFKFSRASKPASFLLHYMGNFGRYAV